MTARLKTVPGVVRAAPIVDGQVMGTQNGVNTFVYVRGMRLGDLASLGSVAKSLTPGALANFSEDAVIIGDGLAQKLGIHRGGSITLISPKGDVTPFGTNLRTKTYMVAGTFKIGNISMTAALSSCRWTRRRFLQHRQRCHRCRSDGGKAR